MCAGTGHHGRHRLVSVVVRGDERCCLSILPDVDPGDVFANSTEPRAQLGAVDSTRPPIHDDVAIGGRLLGLAVIDVRPTPTRPGPPHERPEHKPEHDIEDAK